MRSWVCAGLQAPPSQLSLGHWELEYRCKHNTQRWQHRLWNFKTMWKGKYH
jgi:hypothetical protein